MMNELLNLMNKQTDAVGDLSTLGTVLYIINLVFAGILFIAYFYQNFYMVVGAFTKPKIWADAKKQHKYAYVICAHDEDIVVGNLIKSIYEQDYPRELMQVFVCADNCTDNTAKVAREAGAIVYERKSDIIGKSYALDFILGEIIKSYDQENFDAIFIFDADNLVSRTYTTEMNKLYDAGVRVATSYRDSKNFNNNWVSAGASMCFYREAVLIHHSRGKLGIGTYVSGTGFYVDYSLIKEMQGWKYHTMVEDIEFSIDCANHGVFIGFCEQAIFYDEQPNTFHASVTQRLRWCKGTHQCFYRYHLTHQKESFKTKPSFIKFEMLVHVCPLPIVSFLWTILYLALSALDVVINNGSWNAFLNTALVTCGWFALGIFGFALIHALIVTIRKHKTINAPLWKQILYCFTFPIYAFFFLPLSFAALFMRVKWKKIPHTESKTIEDMEKLEE